MAKRRKDDGTRGALLFLMVLLIIAIVGVMGYTGKIYVDQKNNDNSSGNPQSGNVATTPKDDKKDEQTKTDPVEDTKKDEPEEEVKPKEEPVKEEVTVSDEDKAIDLAKKQYGTTNGVYFRIEQIKSNNEYIVSVRDNETTRDLAWYTIDVVSGTVK